MTRAIFIFDPVTNTLVAKEEYRRRQNAAAARSFLPRTVERGVWVFDPRSRTLVPKALALAEKYGDSTEGAASGPTIVKDIEPYINVRKEYVGGRRQHRDFLRAHGCIEVGNEAVDKRYDAAPGLNEDIKRAMAETGYWKP